MSIPIEEYALPSWVTTRERYPITEDINYRYRNLTINPRTNIGRYAGGGEYGWKAPGYNPNHNSVSIERISIDVDTSNTTFRSR